MLITTLLEKYAKVQEALRVLNIHLQSELLMQFQENEDRKTPTPERLLDIHLHQFTNAPANFTALNQLINTLTSQKSHSATLATVNEFKTALEAFALEFDPTHPRASLRLLFIHQAETLINKHYKAAVVEKALKAAQEQFAGKNPTRVFDLQTIFQMNRAFIFNHILPVHSSNPKPNWRTDRVMNPPPIFSDQQLQKMLTDYFVKFLTVDTLDLYKTCFRATHLKKLTPLANLSVLSTRRVRASDDDDNDSDEPTAKRTSQQLSK